MKEVKQLENKKIDLSSIKVAIFDFDDTLAIHKDKDYLKHRNENEENLKLLLKCLSKSRIFL